MDKCPHFMPNGMTTQLWFDMQQKDKSCRFCKVDSLAVDLANEQKDRANADKVGLQYLSRIRGLETALRSIAMATEQGALYESAAIHNSAERFKS